MGTAFSASPQMHRRVGGGGGSMENGGGGGGAMNATAAGATTRWSPWRAGEAAGEFAALDRVSRGEEHVDACRLADLGDAAGDTAGMLGSTNSSDPLFSLLRVFMVVNVCLFSGRWLPRVAGCLQGIGELARARAPKLRGA